MSTYKQYTIKNTVYFISIYPSGNDIYQITQTKGFVESIIDGKHELYLTLEEAQEAHKKIVGE